MPTAPVKHRHHLRHLDDFGSMQEVAKAIRKGNATVIRVGRPVTFNGNPDTAKEMLEEKVLLADAPQTLIVWPGKHASHVFEVTEWTAATIVDLL